MNAAIRVLLLAWAAGWGAGCGSVVVSPGEDADGTDAVDDGSGEVRDDGGGEADEAGGEVSDGDGEVPASCGDGTVDPGELCDDGNTRDGDGCDADCRWSCTRAADCRDPDVCNGEEVCADHVCGPGSPAADGTECEGEPGEDGVCLDGVCIVPVCPNGRVEPGEECDDGNADPADGCEPDCRFTCESSAECDDGNACNGSEACDGHRCAPGSPLANGASCTQPSGGSGVCREGLCVSSGCGNRVVEGSEECDDGNTVDTDACRNNCRTAICGDGVVRTGHEACDGGTQSCTTACGTTGSRSCTTRCTWPTTCTPPAEVCNGVDDDCAGGCDDGFACCQGTTQPVSMGTCTGTATCATGCAWGEPNFGSPPAFDTCATARVLALTSSGANATGSTCAARNDAEPTCAGGGIGAPEVFYSFTLTARQFVAIDTNGSDYDTVMQLWRTGCGVTSVACNDDISGTDRTSRVSATLEPGTYWIQVDGFGTGGRGTYQLHLYLSTPPANDGCAGAIPITPGPTPQRLALASTAIATGDGVTCADGSGTAGPEIWYSFEVPGGRHLAYFDLLDGQTWGGTLRIHESCTAPPLSCAGPRSCGTPRPQWSGILGSPDGTSRTYYLAVDGAMPGDYGLFTLRHQLVGPPCADGAIEAILADGEVAGSLDVTGSSRTTGSCGGSRAEAIYWIPFCGSRSVSIDTCSPLTGFDSALYVRQSGCGFGGAPGSEVACGASMPGCVNSFGAQVAFGASSGPGLYFLFVDSDLGTLVGGAFRLNVTGL